MNDRGTISDIIRENPEPYIKEYNKRRFIDPAAIMNQFGIGKIKAQQIKQRLEQELLGGG